MLNPTTADEQRRAREEKVALAWSLLLETDAWRLDLEPFLRRERRAYVRAAARMGLGDGDRAVLIGVARALDLFLGRKDRMVARLHRVRSSPSGVGVQTHPPKNSDGLTAIG